LTAATQHTEMQQTFLRGLWFVALALGVMFGATYLELYQTVWQSDEQGQGPVVIAVSTWLIWRKRDLLSSRPMDAAPKSGSVCLILGWFMYVLGRSQAVIQLEAFSHLWLLAGVVLLWWGWSGVRVLAFPLFFLIFLVPLPGTFVQALTVPLKSGVSYAAEALLHAAGYPIARSGVMLQIGPYQLMVADACAGLNSMFTLESLGLLYMNLMGHADRARNIALALCIVPISFISNVVRVGVLVLVTYYFGDAAGQGFVHGFAGLVLFCVALGLMLSVDSLLGRVLRCRGDAQPVQRGWAA
jgi:exosortase B